jgi:hypothetical protein
VVTLKKEEMKEKIKKKMKKKKITVNKPTKPFNSNFKPHYSSISIIGIR